MFLAQESDATKDRLSEKSSERKRHRSRQSNGSVTTSKGRQTIGSVKPTAALQSNESPAPFCQSPTPVPTEQPSNTNFPCPPPLSLPEFDKLGGGSAIGVGHGQQKQLFSDDEDSNPACNPSVALSADEDNVRMVTDAVAEAILAIPFEEQSNQALKHVADLSEPALGVEEPAESDQVETIVPISKHPEMAVPERFDLQPLPHDPKPESQPEQHLVDAWHTLCDDVYIHQNLEKSQAACLSSCSPTESPVLERYHHTCQYCSRAHIPSIPLSCQLQMHCLLGPIHNWERLGCQGFTSPLSLSTNCSAEGSSCDVDYNEAATAAAALILSEQLREDLSQRSRVEKTVAANELYITPPHSPVFDQIDNCVSLGDTKPTQPCFTPSSPPLSPFCTATFAGKPCFLSPVIAPPLHNPTSAYKSAFLSPVSEKCPPQFVSTPVGSPKRHLQLYDVPLDLTDSFCASPSSTHSDSDIQRKLSVHKLDSTSFECILPTDPAEFKARPKADQGRLPKLSSCRRRQSHQSRSLSECNGLDQLPVVRRPKLSAKPVARQGKKTPRVANCTNPRAKNIVQSVRHKRSIPLTVLTPTRFQTPRTAAKVARESISLSVRALFSPSGMDRCFESPCPLIYAAGLSRVPVTPEFYTSTPPTPGRRIKHTLCTINLTPSKGSIRTHGRTLFPERVTT
ncbi:hypothetical protein D915_009269 [Fasciola hepatica]|uniref:Uncharacterized protein n=1 Tax=Fasciola hepatica TaxID=6192 RepID=A0A2H1BWL7_FASHE|nr:hypothetical protein D915_009269 [Fasciola hepatica]